MHTIDYLQKKVKETFDQIKFDSKPDELYQPIDYTLSVGGKRMRPIITLMACDLFGGDINKALNAAVGLELFHNFTLIHDDIMDNAPIRRGQESVYKKWNPNIAILSGDTLFANAYEYMIKTDIKVLVEVLKIFNQTAISICEGQQFDMNFESRDDVSLENYIEMIRLKTAVLIGSCLKIGALIGGASEKDSDNIYQFGENIGLGFQLRDDLLDVFGNEETFGKKNGGDIITNKKTFLYIKAFELAKDDTLKKLTYFFINNNNSNPEDKIKTIKEIYTELNIRSITEKEIEIQYSKAVNHLSKINVSEERKMMLLSFAEKLKVRDS